MSALTIFTEHFTDRLKRSVGDHLDLYKLPKTWVEKFANDEVKWELPTSLLPVLPARKKFEDVLFMPDGDDRKDLENSIQLHKCLPGLDPAQARDPRLWARLVHVEFWPYMRERWKVEKHLADRSRAERYVWQHYFVIRSEGRALLRNGIARLWWYAHLTFDSKRQNPYELTGVLLKSLDITQQILERSMGRCESVLVGFLEFLSENPRLLGGGDENREAIRALAKSLNLFGGVAILDCLSPAALKDHLARELKKFDLVKEAVLAKK